MFDKEALRTRILTLPAIDMRIEKPSILDYWIYRIPGLNVILIKRDMTSSELPEGYLATIISNDSDMRARALESLSEIMGNPVAVKGVVGRSDALGVLWFATDVEQRLLRG